MSENIEKKGLIAKLGADQLPPPWGLGEAVLAFVVLFVGTIIIGSTITANVATDSNNPDPISFVMGWLFGLAIVFVFVMVRWRRSKERFDELRLDKGLWQPMLSLLVGIGGTFTAFVIAGIGSTNFIAPVQVLGIENDIGRVALVALFVMIAQPLTEGLVFWGILQPRLRASLGGLPGLLSAVALFALYYYLVFGSRVSGGIALWYGAIYPLIIGFTLGAVRAWSQSTRGAILAQMGVGISIIVTMLVL